MGLRRGREFTYKMVCDAMNSTGEEGLPVELCRRIEDSMDARYWRGMLVKPIISRRNIFIQENILLQSMLLMLKLLGGLNLRLFR